MAAKNKKIEIAALRRELVGERQVSFTRLAGDSGTDEGERRAKLIWQNFRIQEPTKVTAVVLGTEHPEFCEGKDAAQGNAKELFETELFPAGAAGVPLERLSTVFSHYFAVGFERCVGLRLRQFVTQHFEHDDKTGRAKASPKLLAAMRKTEARALVAEEKDYSKKQKIENEQKLKAGKEMPKPPCMMPSEVAFDPDKRPRYASTKMQPDELEESFGGKGGGKGGGLMMGGMMGGGFM